ncbi:MAG: hypothetical protein EOP50_20610 [Sphingobacteriales bacterium]|nr:MAG: hypothetical protein EOP50_20610 [Sphingobacteriales bacterium]
MVELLSRVLLISTLAFAVTSMLAVGFRYSAREIIEPLRNVGDVIRALVANFVLTPLLAYIVVQLLSLERPFAAGLMLVATAAGAPFLIKLTIAAKADVGLSATLLVLLLPATVLYMPFIVPWAIPQARVNAAISPGRSSSPCYCRWLSVCSQTRAGPRWRHVWYQ